LAKAKLGRSGEFRNSTAQSIRINPHLAKIFPVGFCPPIRFKRSRSLLFKRPARSPKVVLNVANPICSILKFPAVRRK